MSLHQNEFEPSSMKLAHSPQDESDYFRGAGDSDYDDDANFDSLERNSTFVQRGSFRGELPERESTQVERLEDNADADSESDAGDQDSLAGGGGSRDGSEYQGSEGRDSETSFHTARTSPDPQLQAPIPAHARMQALAQPQQPDMPRIDFSQEAAFDMSQWMPQRRGGKFRQYFSTFGERTRQAGFFGALFGRGGKRADRAAAISRFNDLQSTQARARREQEKAAEPGKVAGLNSAMRTRLQNSGPIADLADFPREPGIGYDMPAARGANERFMARRQAFMGVSAFTPSQSKMATDAYDDYDTEVGNRGLIPAGQDTYDPSTKFQAIRQANIDWGIESAAIEQKGRTKPKRVRFMNGADDREGLPVDEHDNERTKPYPTGVRFHPSPITSSTFRGFESAETKGIEEQWRRGALTEPQAMRQAQRTSSRFANEEAAYERNGQRDGHPMEVSDDTALANTRSLWQMRGPLSRMGEMGLATAQGRAMGVEANLVRGDHAPDSPEDEQLRAAHYTQKVAEEVMAERDQAREKRRDSSARGFPLEHLDSASKFVIGDDVSHMDEVEQSRIQSMTNKSKGRYLPQPYFTGVFDFARRMGEQSLAPPARGGAGLIEEENP